MSSTSENERFIRNAYRVAEEEEVGAWIACFNEDGTFTDESIGVTYRGPREVGLPVTIMATAFPDIHRELISVYTSGDVVIVELTLNGTHTGPLQAPKSVIPPSGRRMKAPCCDVFRLRNGRIQTFHCYPLVTDAAWS
jgi:ketosteroid isomerase-like protein